MRPRILLALAVAVPAVLACEARILPQPETVVVGTFVLDADGPVLLQWQGVRATLLADTLRFNPDGTLVRSGSTHYDYDAFRDTTLYTSERYLHRTEGSRVELELVCPPNALCSPPPHLWGTLTRSGLVLKAAVDPRPTLRYRRLAEVGPYSQ
jgi:hypothetical protein